MYRNYISHLSRVWRNTSHYSLLFSLSQMCYYEIWCLYWYCISATFIFSPRSLSWMFAAPFSILFYLLQPLTMKNLGSLWTMKSSLLSESILLMTTFRGMFLTQLCLWHHHLIQGMWLAVSWAPSYFSRGLDLCWLEHAISIILIVFYIPAL